MSFVFRQFKVYARITVLVALALVIAMVVYKNKSNRVDVWFFHSYESINVVLLFVCTALGSIVSWWIVSASVGLWRDVRELSRAAEQKKADQQQRELAAKLAETEKRIDDKLKGAVSREEADSGNS